MGAAPKNPKPRKLKPIERPLGGSSKSSLRYNFIDLTPQLISDHPDFKSLVDHVFDEIKAHGRGYTQDKYNHHLRDHLRLVLLNLSLAYFSDPEKTVRYFRDKNRYSKGTILHQLFIKYSYLVQRVIPYLRDQGYIEDWKGQYFEDSKFASRMRATPKLMEIVQNQHKVTLPMIRRTLPEKDLVILRDEEKNNIDYADTPYTLKMKENLKLINEVLNSNVILLKITDQDLAYLNQRLNGHRNDEIRKRGSIDFTQTSLWRVFNNSSWSQGGRFYGGWWQRILHRKQTGEDYRKDITINGMPTWEYDYSGFHINMLYAFENLSLPEEDVYKLPGYSNTEAFRRFVKRMLLVMVNASSRSSVRKVMHEAVHRYHSLELPSDIKSTRNVDIFPIMDALERKHAPIKDNFCTGKGIDLQYHDSVIAEAILVLLAKHNIPCLPLHDSFIVDCRYHEWLNYIMQAAFRKYFGKDCTVTPKKFIIHDAIERAMDELYNRRMQPKEKVTEGEDKNIGNDYSQYDKMLKEFAEAKGVTIEEYEFRSPTEEELMEFRDDLKRIYEQLQRIEEKIEMHFPSFSAR